MFMNNFTQKCIACIEKKTKGLEQSLEEHQSLL